MLSEELREAIYNEVVARGISVPTVSVQFGVSNERVAAVVRLKRMEKEWIGQVSFSLIFRFYCRMHMMRHKTNSISL